MAQWIHDRSTGSPASDRRGGAGRCASPGSPGARRPPRSPVAPGATRRTARAARYAAVGLSIASTAGLTSLFTSAAGSTQQPLSAAAVVSGSGSTSTVAPAATATTTRATTATTARRTSSVVDGGVFRNRYGDVQVEATFAADGSLSGVTVLQSPSDRSRSIEINDTAVPELNTEAVAAQSARVDTISGATYTSTGYQESLQSAIDAARAGGLTRLT